MRKNVASQKWRVYAFNTTTNAAVTGDAGNITAKLSKNGAALAALGDVNPVELESGFYEFDLTQGETNADDLMLVPVSSTSNVAVVAAPARIATVPNFFQELGIASDGDLVKVNALDGHTVQTGDSFNRLGVPVAVDGGAASFAGMLLKMIDDNGGADFDAALHSLKSLREIGLALTGTAQGGTATTIQLAASAVASDDELNGHVVVIVGGTGIGQIALIVDSVAASDTCTIVTSYPSEQWLTNPDATSVYEVVQATKAAAWLDASELAAINAECDTAISDYGPNTLAPLTAAGVRAAVGLATANLDTQLAEIVADTDELQTDWADGGRLDLLLDAVKVITDALGAEAAANLAKSCSDAGIISGAAETGTLTTAAMTTDLAEATDGHYNGQTVAFLSGGNLSGQKARVSTYTGATGLITFEDALTEAPSDGDLFILI